MAASHTSLGGKILSVFRTLLTCLMVMTPLFKTAILTDPCTNPVTLNHNWRDVANGLNPDGSNCDSKQFDSTLWYSFTIQNNPASIPTTCIKDHMCGAVIGMRIELDNQELPVKVGQNITASLCGAYNVLDKYDCCVLRSPVVITKCSSQRFVYQFTKPFDRCPVAVCTKKMNTPIEPSVQAISGDDYSASNEPTMTTTVTTPGVEDDTPEDVDSTQIDLGTDNSSSPAQSLSTDNTTILPEMNHNDTTTTGSTMTSPGSTVSIATPSVSDEAGLTNGDSFTTYNTTPTGLSTTRTDIDQTTQEITNNSTLSTVTPSSSSSSLSSSSSSSSLLPSTSSLSTTTQGQDISNTDNETTTDGDASPLTSTSSSSSSSSLSSTTTAEIPTLPQSGNTDSNEPSTPVSTPTRPESTNEPSTPVSTTTRPDSTSGGTTSKTVFSDSTETTPITTAAPGISKKGKGGDDPKGATPPNPISFSTSPLTTRSSLTSTTTSTSQSSSTSYTSSSSSSSLPFSSSSLSTPTASSPVTLSTRSSPSTEPSTSSSSPLTTTQQSPSSPSLPITTTTTNRPPPVMTTTGTTTTTKITSTILSILTSSSSAATTTSPVIASTSTSSRSSHSTPLIFSLPSSSSPSSSLSSSSTPSSFPSSTSNGRHSSRGTPPESVTVEKVRLVFQGKHQQETHFVKEVSTLVQVFLTEKGQTDDVSRGGRTNVTSLEPVLDRTNQSTLVDLVISHSYEEVSLNTFQRWDLASYLKQMANLTLLATCRPSKKCGEDKDGGPEKPEATRSSMEKNLPVLVAVLCVCGVCLVVMIVGVVCAKCRHRGSYKADSNQDIKNLHDTRTTYFDGTSSPFTDVQIMKDEDAADGSIGGSAADGGADKENSWVFPLEDIDLDPNGEGNGKVALATEDTKL